MSVLDRRRAREFAELRAAGWTVERVTVRRPGPHRTRWRWSR
jgi:hypothetical protein